MLWRSSSIVCFPCLCVVKQLSRLAKQFRTRVLLLLVLLISPVTFLGWIHLHEAFLDMDTQTKVADYMHWWRMVCENATLHLREEAALQGLPLCPCFGKAPLSSMDGIGILEDLSKNHTVSFENAEKRFQSLLDPGGHWKPQSCFPRQRVAIVIPYRNREEHLKLFVSYMHPYLQTQSLEYQIFIVEQAAPVIFNRAALMNIGFLEAMKLQHFDCFIFHDVDLLPLDPRNPYTCYKAPTHLGAYMNKFNYQMPYPKFFGGAIALSTENMQLMNGFSNQYYGWGGEDDDTNSRVIWRNWTIHRHIQPIGKSYMIKHGQDEANPTNPNRDIGYEAQPELYIRNGINSIQYARHQLNLYPLYTRFLVSIEKEYLPECVLDLSKPANFPGNYLDCLTMENFVTQDVSCCRYDDILQCCNKGQGMYVVIDHGHRSLLVGILGAFGLLMLVLGFIARKRPEWIQHMRNKCPERFRQPLDRVSTDVSSLKMPFSSNVPGIGLLVTMVNKLRER